jgi:hypothetical protein
MVTKFQIYNSTLDHLGEGRLLSISENRGPRHLLDGIWDFGLIRYCLEQSLWKFAIRSVKMEAETAVETDFGYRYVFNKPADYVKTAAICTDEYYRNPLSDYNDEAGIIYADIDTIYVKYVSDGPDYGSDMAKWPETFIEFVVARMAWKAVPRITNSKTTRDDMDRLMRRLLSDAQNNDCVGKPTMFMPRGSWTSARGGRTSFLNIRRRG